MIENYQKFKSKLVDFSTLLYKNYSVSKIKTDVLSLRDCCDIKTGKLNADASVENGLYPFFTCGADTLWIDDYIFDGDLIVIAGNGEISAKYYNGKCNAYQRTYMLHPEKFFFLFLKEIEANIDNLKNNSQGSVIRFITKGMLEGISIPISSNGGYINQKLKDIYTKINNIEKQILELKKIKTQLLSKYF